jgi:outer membrane protein assembly factor BamB/tRNA A-37 threonylcarbamoyl transferase component Bud32
MPIPSGTILQGRYRVTSALGAGGMSTVYKALDLRFANVERVCAVKEMFDGGGDETLRQQRATNFEREAGLLAVLSHPLIPKIFDYFTEGGNYYLVQEFIPGQNLETLIEQTTDGFLETELLDWGLALCDVLSYLHGQSPDPIIFRDLKPSNIMIREDRSLMLIDFGIARGFQNQQRGTMIGTEGYAPPEQYRGVADARTDLYALGATLHHLATRVDPRFETPFTFDQRAPRAFNVRISAQMEEVILRGVAYAPRDRYASAAEFKAALLRCRAATRRLPSAPLSPPAVAAPPRPRRAAILPTATEVLTPTDAPPPAAPRPQVAPTERFVWSATTGDEVRNAGIVADEHFLVGSYDARLYAFDVQSGGTTWQFPAGRGICSAPSVWRDTVIVGSEDGAVYGLALDSGRLKWRYKTNMPVRSSARADEGAGGVLIGSDDGYVYKLDPATGALLWRYRTYGPVRSSAARQDNVVIIGSDDGFLYALAHDSGRQLWRFATGRPILASPTIAEGVVICGSLDGSIYGLGLGHGEFRWRHETGAPVVATAATRDGRAYIGSSVGRFYALDVATGERIWEVPHGGRVTSSAVATAHCVYYGALDGAIYCLDRATGEVIWSHNLGKPIPASPVLYGNVLLIGCTDGKVYALTTGEHLPTAGAEDES